MIDDADVEVPPAEESLRTLAIEAGIKAVEVMEKLLGASTTTDDEKIRIAEVITRLIAVTC